MPDTKSHIYFLQGRCFYVLTPGLSSTPSKHSTNIFHSFCSLFIIIPKATNHLIALYFFVYVVSDGKSTYFAKSYALFKILNR